MSDFTNVSSYREAEDFLIKPASTYLRHNYSMSKKHADPDFLDEAEAVIQEEIANIIASRRRVLDAFKAICASQIHNNQPRRRASFSKDRGYLYREERDSEEEQRGRTRWRRGHERTTGYSSNSSTPSGGGGHPSSRTYLRLPEL